MKVNKDRNKCYLAYYLMSNDVSKIYVLRMIITDAEYTMINKRSTIDKTL